MSTSLEPSPEQQLPLTQSMAVSMVSAESHSSAGDGSFLFANPGSNFFARPREKQLREIDFEKSDQSDYESGADSYSGCSSDDGKVRRFPMLALLAGLGCCLLVGLIWLIVWLCSRGDGAQGSDPLNPPEGWDVIIVGAGTAGCILAERLSQAGESVLLLEGGGDKQEAGAKMPESSRTAWATEGLSSAQSFDVPGEYQATEWNPEFSWDTAFAFQGKVVGGTAATSGMLYVRPTKQDVAAWGLPQSVSDMIEASIWEVESAMPFTTTSSLDNLRYGHEPADAVEDTLRAASFSYAINLNANEFYDGTESRTGWFGWPTVISKDGVRFNSCGAQLPALDSREAVTVLKNAEVKRIEFDNSGRASRVIYELDGQPTNATVKGPQGKVVLAAGALNTPRLLLLSGVGPQADLQSYSSSPYLFISSPPEQWVENTHVGSALRDHPGAILGVSKENVPLLHLMEHPPAETTQYAGSFNTTGSVAGTGPYAQYGTVSMGYFQSDLAKNSGESLPDLAFEVLPYPMASPPSVRYLVDEAQVPAYIHSGITSHQQDWPESAWAIHLRLLKTTKQGKITLDAMRRVEYPDIYGLTQATADGNDMARLQEGITQLATILSNGTSLVAPVDASLAEVEALMNRGVYSHLVSGHFTGSCAIGSCLDDSFKVVNTSNVFVGDASAFPMQPQIQPLGSIMALAHAAGGVIAQTWV